MCTADTIRVSTTCGRVVGRSLERVSAFKGIPFARPPVGEWRWRPPQPAQPWDGERPAFDFGPAPLQELPARASLMYRLNNDDARALVMSEDCLYLNVWTPDPSRDARLPVMVWVHGGALRTGHGGQDLFDGARLAARGAVVVTLNMRLGLLGFLSLPELCAEDASGASGNYGLQDVVAALRWVQDNVAAFGGEPGRVTLAGSSAGAATVSHLMAAPSARGLFRAAIGQSLSGLCRVEGRMPSLGESVERGRQLLAPFGRSLSEWRDQPATAFLRLAPQGVVVDGSLLVRETTDVFLAGEQAAIPLLAGWNADEGSVVAPQGALGEFSVPDAGGTRSALEQHYGATLDTPASEARRALIGDRRFAYPVWRWARTHAESVGASTWVYELDHPPPVPQDVAPAPDGLGGFGTFHTAELPYTWDNLAKRSWAWRDADHRRARQLADAWMRFVADADPNGAGLPPWPRFGPAGDQPVMRFGSDTRAGVTPRRTAFEVFDELLPRRASRAALQRAV